MPISKRIRFEVFKRDSFSCQYCGKTPPNCILEIDHIIPKSKGGKDELINLITSCFDCNRGKDDKDITNKKHRPDIKKINSELQSQLDEMQKYYAIQQELIFLKEEELKEIIKYWYKNVSSYISERQIISIRRFLQDFNSEEILHAIEIACSKTYGWLNRFKYMCGILHNWRKDKNGLA